MSVLELERPTLASELKLSPLARSVLVHLEKGPLTPRTAEVYGITSLYDGIYQLRRAGYNIKVERRRDDLGKRYAKYTLLPNGAH